MFSIKLADRVLKNGKIVKGKYGTFISAAALAEWYEKNAPRKAVK